MKNRARFLWYVTLLAATLASASALHAQFASKTTGGTLEFQVISGASFDRNKVLPVVFVWHPELEPEDTGYHVIAECRRRNRLEAPPDSTNRILFDLTMTPIVSGKEYELGRRRRKLGRDGLQKSPAVWQSTDLEALAAEGLAEGVLVRFEISVVRGGLGFGDTVSCECRVGETGRLPFGTTFGAEAALAAHR